MKTKFDHTYTAIAEMIMVNDIVTQGDLKLVASGRDVNNILKSLYVDLQYSIYFTHETCSRLGIPQDYQHNLLRKIKQLMTKVS